MITTTTTLKMAIAIRLISLKEVEFCSGVRPEQKDIVNVPSDNEKSGAGKNKTKHNCLVFPTHLCPLDSVHIKCRKPHPKMCGIILYYSSAKLRVPNSVPSFTAVTLHHKSQSNIAL